MGKKKQRRQQRLSVYQAFTEAAYALALEMMEEDCTPEQTVWLMITVLKEMTEQAVVDIEETNVVPLKPKGAA
jgi:hypothetical protein